MKSLLERIQLALNEMNPYKLLPDAPEDEFYSEAERIVGQISETDSLDKVASVMASVLSEAFDDTFTADECMKYVIMTYLK